MSRGVLCIRGKDRRFSFVVRSFPQVPQPRKEVTGHCTAVIPERVDYLTVCFSGVCADQPTSEKCVAGFQKHRVIRSIYYRSRIGFGGEIKSFCHDQELQRVETQRQST